MPMSPDLPFESYVLDGKRFYHADQIAIGVGTTMLESGVWDTIEFHFTTPTTETYKAIGFPDVVECRFVLDQAYLRGLCEFVDQVRDMGIVPGRGM